MAIAPSCPACGRDMKLRTAQRGPKAGGQFWGCTGYPECRTTRDCAPEEQAPSGEFTPISAGNRRDNPYLWVTWLAENMSGDVSCQWKNWFRAHHKLAQEEPSGDMTSWRMAHTLMLSQWTQRLRAQGARVLNEYEVRMRFPQLRSTLSGKADLIAIQGDDVTIIDCKTGRPKDRDKVQVMLYMHGLATFDPAFSSSRIRGLVAYQDEADFEIPELPAGFTQSLEHFVGLLSDDEEAAPRVPGNDCRFCPITRLDCPEKVSS